MNKQANGREKGIPLNNCQSLILNPKL
uniref:Uncharacterized protein n=1 Tax=Arundo donax TaxID=35708 RepID=A0A0A9BAS0_ARUDO